MRGTDFESTRKRKREKKVEAGKQLKNEPLPDIGGDEPAETATTSQEVLPTAGPSTSKRRTRPKKNDNICSVCSRPWKKYKGPEWICCTDCYRWTCGICNDQSDDPYFVCINCKEHPIDSDDSIKDKDFSP